MYPKSPKKSSVKSPRRSHLIPDAELERLKRDISLVALVQSYGIVLKQQGKDWIGKCPFHDDSTASLVVSPDKNLWHCLGECNAGGTNIDWVMKIENVGFRRAVEVLRERSGAAAGNGDGAVSLAKADAGSAVKPGKTRLAAPVAMDADDQTLLQQVMSFYQATLLKTPPALAYLASRGMVGEAVIRELGIGFADRSLGMRLPAKGRAADQAQVRDVRARLQKLGILRDSGHEHFTGSIVFPISDENGQITGMYGRKSGRAL